MPNNNLKFKFSEEARIIKAMLSAGLKIARVEKDERGRPVYVVDQGEGAKDPDNDKDLRDLI